MEDDACIGSGSLAGAVIGTFLTTVLLLAVATLLYRQWRRHKGKHLVLVTDPEIVEDAYAFDNPCFKEATQSVALERPRSPEGQPKDSTRWSTPWASLAIGSSGNRNDKRRTLDDSCLGPKATRVSVVSLRSRDFTGLGFNVCGNMREGIFVKDLLHRGPASESGRIHPGDRISSVKISFRNMVYEDALTILSYASPYDVELEVESGGGGGSKPTTLLKKTVGPSPSRICHPLYRSQSIPEFTHTRRSVAKQRLFIADTTESNCTPSNSTTKSSRSTPGSQTLERRHEETRNHHPHHKFGIKVLPSLDGAVHRIENQNEHNTNLERSHSRKMDAEKRLVGDHERRRQQELLQKPENVRTNKKAFVEDVERRENVEIPSEVPTEVHNAAMAARRNRRNSELSNNRSLEVDGPRSPQRNKRKAPDPPRIQNEIKEECPTGRHEDSEDAIDSIVDYEESLDRRSTQECVRAGQDERRHKTSQPDDNLESDTDSEIQNSFTTIELNPSDITIHRTPVPEDTQEDDEDVYRKAASLGDLSKYEARSSTTLERAQSLDMTDTGSKKRKAPLPPPEDINESSEDLTRLERRKLKKSNEWGTLEDMIWVRDTESVIKKTNSSLERSKSAVEINLNEQPTDEANFKDVSIELYNLPLSKRLTHEFLESQRSFDPQEDNSLARIVNDGDVVKSPSLEEVELDFRHASPFPEDVEEAQQEFGKTLRYFEINSRSIDRSDIVEKSTTLFERPDPLEKSIERSMKSFERPEIVGKSVERSMKSFERLEFVEQPIKSFERLESVEKPTKSFERLKPVEKPAKYFERLESVEKPTKYFERLQSVENSTGLFERRESMGKFEGSSERSDSTEKPIKSIDHKQSTEKPLRSFDRGDAFEKSMNLVETPEPVEKPTKFFESPESTDKPTRSFDHQTFPGKFQGSGDQHKQTDSFQKLLDQPRFTDKFQKTDHGASREKFQQPTDCQRASESFERFSDPEEGMEKPQGSLNREKRTGNSQIPLDPLESVETMKKPLNHKELLEKSYKRLSHEEGVEKSQKSMDLGKPTENFEVSIDKKRTMDEHKSTILVEQEVQRTQSTRAARGIVENDFEDDVEYEFVSRNDLSVSSGENSEDSGLVGESMDYSHQDYERPPLSATPTDFSQQDYERPPLPTTPMPQKVTNYITEIQVTSGGQERRGTEAERKKVTSNGKTVGKKPPVPPRRSDLTKSDFVKSDLTKSEFVKSSDLTKPDITKSDLTKFEFVKADLTKADLLRSDLTKFDFTRTEQKRPEPTRTDLNRTEVAKLDLKKSEFSRVDVAKSDSSGFEKSETWRPEQMRSDQTKLEETKGEFKKSEATRSGDGQLVFVSELRHNTGAEHSEKEEEGGKKTDRWIFLGDREQRWPMNSGQSQTVTNIVHRE